MEEINPVQQLINKMNEQAKLYEGKEYNLGNLIDDLEPYKDQDIPVIFDDGFVPGDFMSWRGRYNCLSLDYHQSDLVYTSSIALYNMAKCALNSPFEGYKGGTFIMDKDTPIYKAYYGECEAIRYGKYGIVKIVGIEKESSKIILKTRLIEEAE